MDFEKNTVMFVKRNKNKNSPILPKIVNFSIISVGGISPTLHMHFIDNGLNQHYT